MRIISGQFKNKKIFQPKDKSTRPLKDLVKESIFNIIEHSKFIKINIKNSQVLDLFSGTGSFGLECISRGAKKVFFFENYIPAINVLEKNINILNCNEKAEIFKKNIFEILKKHEFLENSFEIIFLDPPFLEKEINSLLEILIDKKLLTKNGIIILHRSKKNKDVFTEKFKITISKKYGLSKIIFGNY